MAKLSLKFKRWFLYVLALVLGMAVLLLSQCPPRTVETLAYAFSDAYFFNAKRVAPPELVFVEIENTSVREFGRWPWPRSLVAEGLAKLAEAEVIGLDMLFSEPTSLEEDLALAQQLEQLQLVGGVFLNGPQAQTIQSNYLAYEKLLFSSLQRIERPQLIASLKDEFPINPLLEAMPLIAALNTSAAADQKIRHYPLAFWLEDAVLPNLGVQMWRLAFQQDFQLKEHRAWLELQQLPTTKQTQVRLNFYPDAAWQRVSFAQLMQPDFKPESLRNKLVLVGVSEAGVTDLRTTPLGEMAGPLIHLTLLANLLDKSLLADMQPWQMLVYLGFVLGGMFVIWQICLPWLRLIFVIGGAGLIYASGFLLYNFFNIWLEVFYPLLLLGVIFLCGELWLFMLNRAENLYLRTAFSSYLAPALVEKLISRNAQLKLGGQRQEITVLFSDLRNFTPTTELLDTEELVQHLNAYFGVMIAEIHAQQGALDKLMGDAIMALFNAPLPDDNHAYHACLAAINMMAALEKFNQKFALDSTKRLHMGIGINTGTAVVGNLGAEQRFNYTAIGDTVNTAARLESLTKEANVIWQAEPNQPCAEVDILVGENTYLQIKDLLPCYQIKGMYLKGKALPQDVWVLDWRRALAVS